MNTDIYQNTLDLLLDYLPDGWNNMVFYAAYTDGSYSMKYYTKKRGERWIDCFSQNNVSRSDLIKLFLKINALLSKERNELPKESRWNVLTMAVNSAGQMTTEYDYHNISDRAIEYERDWKTKHLT